MNTEYEDRVNAFLLKARVQFEVKRIGVECPKWCEDKAKDSGISVEIFPRKTHIHGAQHRARFYRDHSPLKAQYDPPDLVIDFWNSYADEEHRFVLLHRYAQTLPFKVVNQYKGKPTPAVTAYDVLACIEKNEPGSFEDFCSEFGCDSDSRRAEETWRDVCDQWKKTRAFFSVQELEELAEIAW